MALLVTLAGTWAHYRVIGTNHSNCLTYPTPPRTALLGKLGAALGIPYLEVMEKWEPIVETGFAWTCPFIEEVVMQKRFKLETESWSKAKNIQAVLKNIYGWKKGEQPQAKPFDATQNNTLDSICYLRSIDPRKRLTASWFIKCDDREEELYQALTKPVYPITYGTGEALVRIVSVEKVDAEKVDGEIETKSSAPSETEVDNAYCSRIPRRAVGYKQGRDFVTVWTPQKEKIRITPSFGAYKVGSEIFGVM